MASPFPSTLASCLGPSSVSPAIDSAVAPGLEAGPVGNDQTRGGRADRPVGQDHDGVGGRRPPATSRSSAPPWTTATAPSTSGQGGRYGRAGHQGGTASHAAGRAGRVGPQRRLGGQAPARSRSSSMVAKAASGGGTGVWPASRTADRVSARLHLGLSRHRGHLQCFVDSGTSRARRKARRARCSVTAITGLVVPMASAASAWDRPARYRSEMACWYRGLSVPRAARRRPGPRRPPPRRSRRRRRGTPAAAEGPVGLPAPGPLRRRGSGRRAHWRRCGTARARSPPPFHSKDGSDRSACSKVAAVTSSATARDPQRR